MSLKITYFEDNKGRNELTRLIFAVGGVSYENDEIGYKSYTSLRDGGKLPWGQLPVLAVPKEAGGGEKDDDGEVFGQSCSISRYAAKVAGLYPKNDLDALRSDEVVDAWRDCLDIYYDCFFERKILGGQMQMIPRPSAVRCVRFQALINSELKVQFARFERLLKKNGGQVCVERDSQFPCWADLAIYDLVKTMEGVMTKEKCGEWMKDMPTMKRLVERVDELDSIKKHLEKYPYNDTSHFFESVPMWKRGLETVLFAFVELVFGLKSRLTVKSV